MFQVQHPTSPMLRKSIPTAVMVIRMSMVVLLLGVRVARV